MADSDPLVLRPTDSTAQKGAWLFAALGVIGVVALVIEIATGNLIGAVAAGIVAVVGVVLALVVVAGRSAMRIRVDADSLQIATRRIPRAEIVGLRRRPIREGGLDVVGRGDTVLYSMPAWFDAVQEQQLAAALGVAVEEPPPPAEDDLVEPGEEVVEPGEEDAGPVA
jgi:hypothetical protein